MLLESAIKPANDSYYWKDTKYKSTSRDIKAFKDREKYVIRLEKGEYVPPGGFSIETIGKTNGTVTWVWVVKD